jgi:hypothetical protein
MAWHRFRAEPEELYPHIAARTCTRQELSQVVKLSAESRIRDENDVMKYYLNLLPIAAPLVDDHDLTSNDLHAEFFRDFHKNGQDILADYVLFNVNPRHPATEPFSSATIFCHQQSLQRRVCNVLRAFSRIRQGDPDRLIQQLSANRHSPNPKPTACDESTWRANRGRSFYRVCPNLRIDGHHCRWLPPVCRI